MCLIQAALAPSAQNLTAAAMLGLIIQLWLNIRAANYGPYTPRQRRWTTIALLVTPYLIFVAVFVISYLKKLRWDNFQLRSALPARFYCMLGQESDFFSFQYGLLLSLQVATFIIDACVLRTLYHHWRSFRHRQSDAKSSGTISLSLILRVLAFSTYRAIIAVGYGAVLVKHTGVLIPFQGRMPMDTTFVLDAIDAIPVWVDMLQATVPLVAFLLFSTNKIFLNVLLFWRRASREEDMTHNDGC